MAGLIKHAYIGEGREKPYRIIVKVDHEAFEKLLREEWLNTTASRFGARAVEELNESLRLEWRQVERQVGDVTVVLEVPVVHAPPYLSITYPNTYLRLALAPLLEILPGDPLWLSRAQLWLHYNTDNARDPYPPNWLAEGGVCWQWGMFSVRLALALGDNHVYYLEVNGRPGHSSAVYCSEKPVYYKGYLYGGYYGLLATNGTAKLVCWLWTDTGYVVGVWSTLPKRGAYVVKYLMDEHGVVKRVAVYSVVKTWMGRGVPRDAAMGG